MRMKQLIFLFSIIVSNFETKFYIVERFSRAFAQENLLLKYGMKNWIFLLSFNLGLLPFNKPSWELNPTKRGILLSTPNQILYAHDFGSLARVPICSLLSSHKHSTSERETKPPI